MTTPAHVGDLGEPEVGQSAALERHVVLDTAPGPAFDRLTRLTARVLQVPVALIWLTDGRRHWLKSCHGCGTGEAEHAVSLCANTLGLGSGEMLVIPDMTRDECWLGSPLVLGTPHLRFCAGTPLITPDGRRLGTLCVFDTVAHADFSAAERETLRELAASVLGELKLQMALEHQQHSETVNAAILSASPDAIITLDAQGLITQWNPAAEQLSGYPRDEMLGRSSELLISELQGAASGQAFWTFFQNQALQQTERFVVPIYRRDRTTFPGEVALLTLQVNGERLYTLIIRDLTVQETARAELVSQRNMLRTVIDNVAAAIYVKDQALRYLMFNASVMAVLGQPAEAILGHTDEALFPQETAAGWRLQDERVLLGGPQTEYEHANVMPDGSTRIFRTTKTVYQDHQGETVGLIGVSTDITERKAAETTMLYHNELLIQRAEQAQLEILERLALAAEYRDDDTGEHMLRVGTTAAALARELGLPEAEVQRIRRTAPLHDLGKIGVPDSILLKPGRLSAEEFEVVKCHSQIGASILTGGQSPLVGMAETIALTHHERWDGTGYPAGLAGEAIPLVGRIVAVADVLDALLHERPYKPAWSLPAALSEIRAHSGSQFDPQVVRALLRLNLETQLNVASKEGQAPQAAGLPGEQQDGR